MTITRRIDVIEEEQEQPQEVGHDPDSGEDVDLVTMRVKYKKIDAPIVSMSSWKAKRKI